MQTDPEQLPKEIRSLEKKAARLEPDGHERDKMLALTSEYIKEFMNDLPTLPVFNKDPGEGIGLADYPISEQPESLETLLEIFHEQVVTPGLNPAHPGHLGYIPGSGLFVSALGDLLAAVTNRYSGIYAACPGAARMENMVIQWFAKAVGYPENAAGDLTSGGSIANLSAIVAARDAKGLKANDFSKAVIYLCDHTHHCVEKAVRTAGLGESVIRRIPVDDHFRMIPKALEEQIKSDQADQLLPWLLVASAGTTDTGSVDPLQKLSAICRQYGLWFHVDGAYGASFILCESGQKKLKGIHLSDSLTMDPHKGLFSPFGTGILLVKNAVDLHRPYRYQANYLQDENVLAELHEVSAAEISPELTRHFRGMRVWLALKYAGQASFSAALEEKIRLAQYAWHRLQQIDGIETGPFPDLSIVFFRAVPKTEDPEAFNRKLLEKIVRDGKVYMSSTLINNKFMLRIAVLSFRTHLEKIEQALTIIETCCRTIKEDKNQ